MGVPSYFSYIIRNYPNIIRDWKFFLQNQMFQFHHLFMDCNSIIYDAFHSLDVNEKTNLSIEDRIINKVCANIKDYVSYIKPTKTLYISFDGVAPLAKMEQQRTRRHRTKFLSKLEKKEIQWDTCAITPGTEFMKRLSSRIKYDFKQGYKNIYNTENIVVSCSDEPGEGEHKLFSYIRNNDIKIEDNIAVYGLDSDLIMLSLFHLKYCNNIFVFRDTPEFLKSKLVSSGENSFLHFLDIFQLANSIQKEMSCENKNIRRIYDYVFMCFFLGNDFLPHFPSLNIRTHGMGVLLDIYRLALGKYHNKFFITENNEIDWCHVKSFVIELAKHEKNFLLKEYSHRENYYQNKLNDRKMTDKDKIDNLPLFYRIEEKYICPYEEDWETRYYKSLFHLEKANNYSIKAICNNYLQGLEWVFSYYTNDCKSWKWKYDYHFPPLLSDLVGCIPNSKLSFLDNDKDLRQYRNAPYSDSVQLCYVLPKESFSLLSKDLQKHVKKYDSYYAEHYEFSWAFCRYFWESHVLLPTIKTYELENWHIMLN